MSFKNEGQLYQVFIEAIKEAEEMLRDHSTLGSIINGEFRYLDRGLNGRQLHLLGEEHYSRKPVDYIHQNLVTRIESGHQTWLVLREDAEDVIENPLHNPTHFYIQELAKLFRLPYEEALAGLWAPDTRAYIQRKSGISEEDIDRLLLTGAMGLETDDDIREDFPCLVRRMSENLQKPSKYTLRLLLMGPKTDLDFEEVVGKYWNDYSRERFHKLLKDYPDRTDILVSVGYGHLPAFE